MNRYRSCWVSVMSVTHQRVKGEWFENRNERPFRLCSHHRLLLYAAVLTMVWVHNNFGVENKMIVIAHRGACGYVAEHTAPAKAMAHAMGADYIEQDVVLTSDDQPVVLHDIHLDTVTDVAKRFPNRKREDGRYYAIDFTLAEVKQLKVNERKDWKTGASVFPNRFPQTETELRVLTLGEEIRLIQGLNQSTGREAGIYPEIKSPTWHRQHGKDISQIVLQTLAKHGYVEHADKAYVQCFEGAETQRLRNELKSNLKLIQLIGNADYAEAHLTDWDTMSTAAGLKGVAKYADGIGPSLQRIVTGRNSDGSLRFTNLVTDAHAAGLAVHPYTFRADRLPDYAGNLNELFDIFVKQAKVDGLFTDFPDLAIPYR